MAYDVVVLGGGSAGVAAAIGAARAGARVALVESYGFLGGAATASAVMAYCGFYAKGPGRNPLVGGVGSEFLHLLATLNGSAEPITSKSGNWYIPVDGEAVKLVLDRMVKAEKNLDLFLHSHFIGATTTNQGVQSISCREPGGIFELRARSFVDASGDALLVADAAPESVRSVAPGHRQVATQVMRIGGVPSDAVVDGQLAGQAVRSARIAERLGVKVREEGMLFRVPGTTDVIAMLADQDVDALNSASLTRAEMAAREVNFAYIEAFRTYLPGFKDAHISATGPKIGVRQARITLGKYVLTGSDLMAGAVFDDQVALGGWPIEVRSSIGSERYTDIPSPGSYGIPLRSLMIEPVPNLLVAGRAISCDDEAYGSLRVMGTSFATGHAAGVAAALGSDATNIRKELSNQGALL